MIKLLLAVSVTLIFFTGCKESQGSPKPRAYPRIEYPERKYVSYKEGSCPYTFEYPAYAEIRKKEEECWFDIFMPVFDARIHCSYLQVKNHENYDELVHDAFVIAAKINERANFMQESRIKNEHGTTGLLLNFTGPAASPVHFFLTDTTNHFFKAALYFDSKVRPDSLSPIVDFIKVDIDRMIATFTWTKN